MSLFDTIGHAASGVGDFVGGAVHAGQDLIGGGMHAAGDLAHGAVDAGHDIAGGIGHAGGHLMGGLSHGWSDLMHGDIGGAVGSVAGGIGGAAGDLAHGQMDAMGHMGGGILHAGQDLVGGALHAGQDMAGGIGGLVKGGMPLVMGGMGIKSGIDMFRGAGGSGIYSKALADGSGFEKLGKADGIAKGVGSLNKLLGFGSSSKKEEDKDSVDHGLDTAKGAVGGVKTAVEAPAKIFQFAENAAKGILPGGGMVEKLTGGALKEGEMAAKVSKIAKPVGDLIEKGGTKLLEGPIGKMIGKEGAKLAGGAAGKIASKIVPGLNVAMAGISALESGKDAAERWQKGDKVGAAIEGLHTVTNLAGAIPGIGGAISVGGDLVAGAAHWLADGGAKKLGSMASGVAGAVGGAVGGAAKAVGGAIGGAAKKIFGGW